MLKRGAPLNIVGIQGGTAKSCIAPVSDTAMCTLQLQGVLYLSITVEFVAGFNKP